jgi:small subunit ribosomal protein S20
VANIKSQIKRNRQNEKRRLRNKAVRSELRTRVKAAEAGGDGAEEALQAAMRTIDKAAAKGVIHKNEASRRKSRLQKRVAANS